MNKFVRTRLKIEKSTTKLIKKDFELKETYRGKKKALKKNDSKWYTRKAGKIEWVKFNKDTDVHTGAPAVPPRINLILIYTFQ